MTETALGCLIRGVNGAVEAVVSADDMAEFARTVDARRALKGSCVYVVYAAHSDAIKVGSSRAVIKRWNTLDEGCPEPLQLIMVWRTEDTEAARERLLGHVFDALDDARIEGRKGWFRATESGAVLEELDAPLPVEPAADATLADAEVPLDEVLPEYSSLIRILVGNRLPFRLHEWSQHRDSVQHVKRVRATMVALSEAGMVTTQDVREALERSTGEHIVRAWDDFCYSHCSADSRTNYGTINPTLAGALRG